MAHLNAAKKLKESWYNMTKQQLHDLILKNHDKLKRFPHMETVTKEWLKALDKVKGGK